MVKATLLVHLHTFVLREHGSVGWSKLLGKLARDDRELLSELLIVGAWRPVGVWNRALDTFLVDNYRDPDEAMTRLAKFVASEDLTTLFKVVLKVGTPDFVLGRTPSLYHRYFNAGRFQPEKLGPKHWRATLTAPLGVEEGPGRFSCGPGISAWLSQALELTGARARVAHPRCRFLGSSVCEYDLSW